VQVILSEQARIRQRPATSSSASDRTKSAPISAPGTPEIETALALFGQFASSQQNVVGLGLM
jgi:hypothetical protein